MGSLARCGREGVSCLNAFNCNNTMQSANNYPSLSTDPSTYLPIHPHLYPSTLPIHFLTYPYPYPTNYPSLSTYPSTYLSIHIHTHPTYPLTTLNYPTIQPPTHPYPSIHIPSKPPRYGFKENSFPYFPQIPLAPLSLHKKLEQVRHKINDLAHDGPLPIFLDYIRTH